jgi:membrane protein DedA with SNARE-associated domain
MEEWIIEVLNQFGYLGIGLLIAIENIFPPIPSEVILTFGGFMTTTTDLTLWGVVIAATLGAVLGAVILYGVGRLLSAERLGALLDGKVGKLLHFKKEDVYKACDWFNKRGKLTVLFCRCVPIVRSLISIPAGMAKMKFDLFLLLTTAGTLVWNIVLVTLGVVAGESWESIVAGTDVYKQIAIVALLIAGGAVLFFFVKHLLKNRQKP